eukprot:7183737-Pyramimonas_sp.AAC.1
MLNWHWLGKLPAMDPWALTLSAVPMSEVCDANVKGDRRYPDVCPLAAPLSPHCAGKPALWSIGCL